MRACDVPIDECLATDDGAAVVVRVGDDIKAFVNRCPHQGAALAGGWIDEDGVLSCPHHFWRFDAASGTHMGAGPGLTPLPVEIVDGQVIVDTPAPPPERSIRDVLLDHAATWRRDAPRSDHPTTDESEPPG